MVQVRLHVQGDAVEAYPAAHLDPDGGDLVLAGPAAAGVVQARPLDPDADAAVADLALDVEAGEGPDDPGLQPADEGAHVPAAPVQVQHHIGDPLAGPVIGVLAAAAALEDWKTLRIQQIGGPGRDPGGV